MVYNSHCIYLHWFYLCNIYFTGHVDPGEDDLQTAIRETLEESGLKETEHYTINHSFRKELHVSRIELNISVHNIKLDSLFYFFNLIFCFSIWFVVNQRL